MFAQRRPFFHRLLDCEDELFALVTAALDRQSLLNGSSSFAESLYGLRRSSTRGKGSPKASLNKSSQRWSLLFLVRSSQSLSCNLLMQTSDVSHCGRTGCCAILAFQDGDHVQQASTTSSYTCRIAHDAKAITRCSRNQLGTSLSPSQAIDIAAANPVHAILCIFSASFALLHKQNTKRLVIPSCSCASSTSEVS